MGLVQSLDVYLTQQVEDFIMKLDNTNTEERYYAHINEFTHTLFNCDAMYITQDQLSSITTETIINYFTQLYKQTKENGEKLYKNSTYNNKLSAIKEFLRYMDFRRLMNKDFRVTDLDYIKHKKKDSKSYDTLPMWAVHEVLEYYEKHEKRLKTQKIWFVKLAVETGLRTNEVLALRKENFKPYFDGQHMMVHSVDAETRAKGNKDWKDLIHIDFYNQMAEELFTEDEQLFTTNDSTMLKTLQRTLKRLNIHGNYVLHSLKRTAVNNTKRFTNDNGAAQAKGKHSSFATTGIYLDEVGLDYGATGFFSMQCKVEERDLIQKSSHEDLLKAIDNLDDNVKMLLEIELQKLKG